MQKIIRRISLCLIAAQFHIRRLMRGHLGSTRDSAAADRQGVLPSFQHERPLRLIWRHDDSRPADWLMFRRSTTGMPTFSLSSWFGIPGNFKLFRNSVGYSWSMLLLFVDALHTVSELWYVTSSPSICFIIYSFISSTVSFLGHNIALSSRNFGSL